MAEEKKQPLVMWQLPMKRVLTASAPLALASIYFFGWRALGMLAVVNFFAFATEYLFIRSSGGKVSSAVFVTGTLLALSLPPALPLWMGAVGAVVGVTFGKMVFGGFGKNVFNPALVGRAFLYINFSSHMTKDFTPVASGPLGGFTTWGVDTLTQATPMNILAETKSFEIIPLLTGNTSGSLGETCAILILLGGIYLVWKRAANWRLVTGCLAGFLLMQTVLWLSGAQSSGVPLKNAVDPLSAMLSGAFLFGVFYFVTEPVSAPTGNEAKWVYAVMIGILTALIRLFSNWSEGMMFAILLGNVFASITDIAFREWKKSKKKKAQAK